MPRRDSLMLISRQEFIEKIPELDALFDATFHRSLEPGFLQWRYADGPIEDVLVAIEVAEGEIAASYSLCPLELVVKGQKHAAALSMTTMTHPRYQGLGLFTKLANELYSSLSDRYSMVFGFPNPASHPIFVSKLRWQTIYEIPTFVLRPQSGRVSPKVIVSRGLDEQFSEPNWLDAFIHTARTPEYITWRFFENPTNQYEIIKISNDSKVGSYAVVKEYQGGLDLVDFIPASLSDAEELLDHIAAVCLEKGLIQINAWQPVHSPFRLLFERRGFVNQSPVTYFGALPIDQADSLNWGNWYIQMSDSDVF